MEEFSKVMQTLDYVPGLHNCLEFSQPSSCLDEAIYKHGKNTLMLNYIHVRSSETGKGLKVIAYSTWESKGQEFIVRKTLFS